MTPRELVLAELAGMRTVPLLELAERLGLDAGEVIGAAQRAAADPFEPPIPGHGWSQDVHAEYARRSTTLILERIADAWLTR